jgi:protein TonB
VEEVAEDDNEIFIAVEEMPVLIGGIQGIAARLRYPEVAQLAGIEGRVFVQFVINKEGRVEDAVVIKGQGGGLDEEALRVVRTAQFKPGKQRGRPVKVRMSMPITFRLEDKKQ